MKQLTFVNGVLKSERVISTEKAFKLVFQAGVLSQAGDEEITIVGEGSEHGISIGRKFDDRYVVNLFVDEV